MTLPSSFVTLSVICSGDANGFGRVAPAEEEEEELEEADVVLLTITYPMVGEEIKSSMIVDLVRFSTDIIALASPAILYVVSKLPTLDEPSDKVYVVVPSLVMWINDCCCAAAGSIVVVMPVAATAIAVITVIKTAILWDIMCSSVSRKKLFIRSSPISYH
jgi:hypothetical protein